MTVIEAEAAERIAEALGADVFDGDAHALLMSIYKDAKQPIALRLLAAKTAIGYEKPRLAAVEASFEGQLTLARLDRGVLYGPRRGRRGRWIAQSSCAAACGARNFDSSGRAARGLSARDGVCKEVGMPAGSTVAQTAQTILDAIEM